jgi:Rrf2 family protein
MIDLAQHHGRGPISLKSIAERQSISEAYLEQLFATLRRAHLVQSIRGSMGGYLLTQDPLNISVGDIIRALEGPVLSVNCLEEYSSEICPRLQNCQARQVWTKLQTVINNTLDSIYLESLIQDIDE